MKYAGRIVCLLIASISSLVLILTHYFSTGYMAMIYFFISMCYMFGGWWLGKKYDRIKYFSEKDVLTESYNRRFVIDIFPKLRSLSDRKSQKLIIFLVDIDNFKLINDMYDHATGDNVLQMVSYTLKNVFRKSDYVVRWGGDEFLVLLPCSDQSGMAGLQNRLHAELNQLSQAVSAKVSVSSGFAVYPDEGIDLDKLINIADQKMYRDKQTSMMAKRSVKM